MKNPANDPRREKAVLLEMLDPLSLARYDLTEPMLSYAVAMAMGDRDEDTRSIARKIIGLLIEKWPELIERILVDTKTAMKDSSPATREAAQQVLWIVLEKRPDVIDAALIDTTAKTAVTDANENVRSAALRTLETLAWLLAC